MKTKKENSKSTAIGLMFKELGSLLGGSKATTKRTPLAFYGPPEKPGIQKLISKCTGLTTLGVGSPEMDCDSSMEETLIESIS
jgi:hypothetical protein